MPRVLKSFVVWQDFLLEVIVLKKLFCLTSILRNSNFVAVSLPKP